jgi:O-antigen ligase
MKPRSRTQRGRSRPEPVGLADRLIESAVVVAVVGVPLAMGGRHPIGAFLLTAAAVLAVGACLARVLLGTGRGAAGRPGEDPIRTLRLGAIEVLAVAGIVVGCLQLVPLPHRVLAALSTHYDTLLPLWSGHPGPGLVGEWNRLSLVPDETMAGLGIFIAQAVLVAVVAQRVRGTSDVERLLALVAAITTALAALGIAQYLAGNGKFLWLYEHIQSDAGGVVKGTFSNRNHYASFLAAGVGAVIWWALHPTNQLGKWRTGLGLLATATVIFAGLSSLSRGGTIAMVVATLVAVGGLANAGLVRPGIAAGLGAGGILAGIALKIHGSDRLSSRLADLFDAAFREAGFNRLVVWQAAWRTITDFPWLGTGIGSHAEISPHYMPATGSTIYTHAESSYLNLGVETGLVGLALAVAALLVGLAACGVLAWRGTPRERAVAAALAAGIVSSGVHAAGDFIWYAPACSTLVLLYGACAIELAANHLRLLAPCTVRIDRMTGVIVAGFLAVALVAIGTRQVAAVRAEPEWEAALRESRRLAAAAEPADGEAVAKGLDRTISRLERVVRHRPEHPRAWAMLALARVERFGLRRRLGNASATLVDLREAAFAARFSARDEFLEWLRATAPKDADELELAAEEAHRAVTACPLAGDAWCALAALAFLESPDRARAAAFVDQAVLVRPMDGRVLFEAGGQAALDGDQPKALDSWRRSFATGPEMRGRILGILTELGISPTDACDLLAGDLDGLRAIDAAWSGLTGDEALREVRSRRLASVLDQTRAPANVGRANLTALHLEAAGLQQRLGDEPAARQSLLDAIRVEPASYSAHLTLADHAVRQADWTTARSEVEWCLLRRPENRQLQEKLRSISRAQAESATSPR